MRLLFSLLILLATGPTHGAGDDVASLKANLARVLPAGTSAQEVARSQIPGLYEVVIDSRLYYASADGKYLFMGAGNLIDLESLENLSDIKRATLALEQGRRTLARLAGLTEEQMIVFAPEETLRVLTVFTDVDCPYCAKFHRDVPRLVEAGVKVRYLLFPRNGLKSKTYQRSVAVWCADDRRKAIGVAKAGGKLEMKSCPNPVAEHYRLGREIGVTGTPTIVLDDGQILPGYRPAREMLALLGLAGNVSSR